jgi:malate dehydrogenase (oxaloacetate-decarboxylating)
MLNFTLKQNDNKRWIETNIHGRHLLNCAQLNKGTAFSEEERQAFHLIGKLPSHQETLEEQLKRAYFQFQTHESRLRKNMFLHEVHENNRVLFYKLVSEHIEEMLPIIYTPTVSTIVKLYSQKFRSPRGLYITYQDRDNIEDILDNRTNPQADIIVATDGEGVLGIGDQGVGGMEIAVAKLMVYTLCGGLNPARGLPIFLDVGTNNEELLNDPMYLGWRNNRISAEQYDEFIRKFIAAIKKKLPNVFLHWEDLGRENAARVLSLHQDALCTFNDDVQGTGIVATAALLSAMRLSHLKLHQQDIVIYGAGSAGIGIATQLKKMLQAQGLTPEQACAKLWLIDRFGLIVNDMAHLTKGQQDFAKPREDLAAWHNDEQSSITLDTVVAQIKPAILIGCSGHAGAFKESVVREMAKNTKRPVILPLSNPTTYAEATPADLLEWTGGSALIATGSPFPHINYYGQEKEITQCNNALIFPAIGLGIAAVNAKRLTPTMLHRACLALSEYPHEKGRLLPAMKNALHSAKTIALAIAKQAVDDGVCDQFSEQEILQKIDDISWQPAYLPFKYVP